MSALQMSRNELYLIDKEIKSMQNESPALALLLTKPIKLFYERAGMQLKIMRGRYREIQEKYIQKDDLGNFLTEGEGDSKEWKFIDSKVDLERARVLDRSLVKEAFNKECHAFFSQHISFEW